MKAPGVDPDDGGSAEEAAASASSSLLLRLKAREAAAWERLTYLYGPTVYGWCRAKGLPPEDAADIRQEVFLAVARAIAGFRRDRPGDSFRGWLWTITLNKIRNHCQRRVGPDQAAGGTTALEKLHQIPEEAPAEDNPPPFSEGAGSLYRRALELIQSEFAERTWQAFWKVAVDGQEPKAVAAELGMSPGAVYIAKSRVRRRLQEEFAGLI